MAQRKQSRGRPRNTAAPSRTDDAAYHGEEFPDAARLYPGYSHDFASPDDGAGFSEEFKSWRKNQEPPPRGPK